MVETWVWYGGDMVVWRRNGLEMGEKSCGDIMGYVNNKERGLKLYIHTRGSEERGERGFAREWNK